MKILIAADMEGVTGVVHWDQVNTSHPEYGRFRRLMTGDVNAAIRGAFEGGATEVSVTDGHSYSRNILIEELDARARLNSGTPSPLSMVQGVDQEVDGVMFVGYHARIGTQNAILEHTWSDERVANLWINGKPFGESGLNGAVCGHFGAAVIMVSGDQAVCAEVQELFGEVETAVVKWAAGRFAAECLPPEVAQKLIQEAAERAVRHLRAGKAPKPFKVKTPVQVKVDFVQSEMADRAMLYPEAKRNERSIEVTVEDMVGAYAAFRALLALAKG
jgi:D-amino peptidase